MSTKIITNNHIRYAKYYPHDMTNRERKQVESAYGGLIELEDAEFVFYRDYPYYVGDCMRIENNTSFEGWDGYFGESFFSCILVKFATDDNFEQGYIFALALS